MIIMPVNTWSEYKATVLETKKLDLQYSESSDRYELYAQESGIFIWNICLLKDDGDDVTDFETYYKANANQPVVTQVVTQFEVNDKDLKLARDKATVNSETKEAISYILIPGDPSTGKGRWVAGGYGVMDSYDPDDYFTVYVEDKDRIIAWAVALQINPSATEPVSDETIRGMGEIPGYGAFPNYPIVKSYTDDELPSDNQGWYLDPMAVGNSSPPVGYADIEPIAGYGHIPSGYYLKTIFTRSNQTTGTVRISVWWGKKE